MCKDPVWEEYVEQPWRSERTRVLDKLGGEFNYWVGSCSAAHGLRDRGHLPRVLHTHAFLVLASHGT